MYFTSDIAVVIPVYNRPRIVVEALESVAAQTRLPSCVVVVDDGSTDDTADVVERWLRRRQPRFDWKIVRQANQGAAAARQRGVREADGVSLLAFLDSDDLWPPDFLERAGLALDRHPEAVAASSDSLYVDFRTGRSRLSCVKSMQYGATVCLVRSGPVGTPNTVVRRQAFHRVGGFAPLPCLEDYDFMLRLSLRGPWVHVPGVPVQARRNVYLSLGGEPPLSKRYDDRALRYAEVVENFLHVGGGSAVVPEQVWRPRLAHLWYRAGKDCVHLGNFSRASACFTRTLVLSRWHLGARVRRLLLPCRT